MQCCVKFLCVFPKLLGVVMGLQVVLRQGLQGSESGLELLEDGTRCRVSGVGHLRLDFVDNRKKSELKRKDNWIYSQLIQGLMHPTNCVVHILNAYNHCY